MLSRCLLVLSEAGQSMLRAVLMQSELSPVHPHSSVSAKRLRHLLLFVPVLAMD